MLTNRPGGKSLAWLPLWLGAALSLSAITLASAHAAGVGSLSCVGGRWSSNCIEQWGSPGDPYIRSVPPPDGEGEKAETAAREHQWLFHCHPVVRRDALGVARYQYAAPGCEYGVGAD